MSKRNQRTLRNGNQGTLRNGNQGTLRNGRGPKNRNRELAMKDGRDGGARTLVQSASASPVRTGALDGPFSIDDTMREAAGKATSLARDARESAQNAGQSALAFAKRNPVPLALAGVGAACAGVGLALWLFGDRETVK